MPKESSDSPSNRPEREVLESRAEIGQFSQCFRPPRVGDGLRSSFSNHAIIRDVCVEPQDHASKEGKATVEMGDAPGPGQVFQVTIPNARDAGWKQ